VWRLTLADQGRNFVIETPELFLCESDTGTGFRKKGFVLLLGSGCFVKSLFVVAFADKSTAITDMGGLLPARADNGLIVLAMLVAHGAVIAINMLLRGNTWIAKSRPFAEKLVLTVVVVLPETTVPPQKAVRFDFLGDGCRILSKCVGNTGITHFVIQ
jgi:hypothetical protein